MSNVPAAPSQQQTLARALEALRDARQRLEHMERSRREALAILGMACRFPGGANSPHEYWRLIAEGRDGISEVPRDRWPYELFHSEGEAPGKMRFRQGGFVDNVDGFDAAFFGISPREAERMDPQQRMVLQVTWEALDDAGLEVESLAGSKTGVWVGVNSQDYLNLQLRDPATIDTYTLVGGTSSIVANRLSYLLDLRGPSLAVDTACSTALVAVHLACQSLRAGECDLAIVAAVNLILSPFATMAHVRGMPLAEDYHCKTFDARADGYVRGEGCGVIVLRRLSDAQRLGDSVWAQIRGSAVNQDGRTNGMTAPNGLSQQAVIRQALDSGAIPAGSVGYLEAHGTGTALGDPIEVEALQQVYGEGRGDRCALGSVKPNIGHLESAAGIAGLMKVALALHHRKIPGLSGFQTLNPHIELDGDQFYIPTTSQEWSGEARRGAVSAFGAGGTNAHVVLEQAPAATSRLQPPREAAFDPPLVVLTGRDDESLRRTAEATRSWLADVALQGGDVSYADLAYTTVHRRSWRDHRMVVAAASLAELEQRLQRYLAGVVEEELVVGRAPAGRWRKVVFVCPGQGSQWLKMGQDLLERPAFRTAIEACDAEISRCAGWSLLERLRESVQPFERIDVIQPTLWAVTVALAALWRAQGVVPDVVIGHSMGEVAAAVICGALSLADGAKVICRRSKLLMRVAGKGLMLLVGQGPDEVAGHLRGLEDRASIAVCNSPGTAVISGDPEAIGLVEAKLRSSNVFHRRIAVDVASHSPQMDPLADELRQQLAELRPLVPTSPMLSTVDGELVEDARLDADYWVRNLRAPVRFGDATARLLREGHDLFLELSPHPILCTAIEQTIEKTIEQTGPSNAAAPVVLSSMQRDRAGIDTMRLALAAVVANGGVCDKAALCQPQGQVLRLPPTQWRQRPFWFCEDRWAPMRSVADAGTSISAEQLLRDATYQMRWVPRPASGAGQRLHSWLVLGGDPAERQALSEAFSGRGVEVSWSDSLERDDERWAKGGAPGAVLDLRGPRGALHAADPSRSVRSSSLDEAPGAVMTLLETLRHLSALRGGSPRLWQLTRGALDLDGHNPAAAALWGLGRAAALERSAGWGGLVDVPARASIALVAKSLVDALLTDDAEDQLALSSEGVVLVPRLEADPTLGRAAVGFSAELGTTLVAGPRGAALAAIAALRERGLTQLLWMDPTEKVAPGSGEDASAVLSGVRTITPAQLSSVAAELSCAGAPVRAALYILAPPAPCSLGALTSSHVRAAFEQGAGCIERLLETFANEPLQELAVVSTVAGSWGSMAMGHAGAAAAYVEASLRARRGPGRAYAVLESTPWADGDMVPQDALDESTQLGVQALPANLALAAVLRSTSCAPATRSVGSIDWARLRMVYEAQRPRPFLAELGKPSQAAVDGVWLEELRALPAKSRAMRLREHLVGVVATLLRYPSDGVGVDTGFFQLGMDSIMAMALRRRLASAMGQAVPASLIFEHPTVARLARELLVRAGLVEQALQSQEATREQAERALEAEQLLAAAAAMSEQELLDALANELE